MAEFDESSYALSRKRFTKEEDDYLRVLATDPNLKTWRDIANYLPGRTAAQCRDRYNQYLAPTIVRKNWTEEEDQIIIEKYKEYGPNWKKISEFLPGRSGNNIKNRWNGPLQKYHGIAHKKSKICRREPRNIINSLDKISQSDYKSNSIKESEDIIDNIMFEISQQESFTDDLFDTFEETSFY